MIDSTQENNKRGISYFVSPLIFDLVLILVDTSTDICNNHYLVIDLYYIKNGNQIFVYYKLIEIGFEERESSKSFRTNHKSIQRRWNVSG
jgi:hypothetical protein